MATVRISRMLLKEVEGHIQSMREATYKATIEPQYPAGNKEFKDKVIDAGMQKIWSTHASIRTVVPEAWLKRPHRMDITFGGRGELQIEGLFLVPPDSKGFSNSYVEVSFSDEEAEAAGILGPLRAYAKLNSAHRDKFDAATEKVLNFLKSCKSVNDALKKYPDIALYLPQGIKDTVDRVVERAKAGEKEAQVLDVLTEDDRNALTTTGVVGALFVGK
jgi:hypothetical protein